MFNPKTSKIKHNETIVRWRMKLSCNSFDVTYCPAKENAVVDRLSRICHLVTCTEDLQNTQKELYHPSTTRMSHVVRSRNLPYSVEHVKIITNSSRICAENNPRFYKPSTAALIKATQPFERLNLNFKEQLLSNTKKYIYAPNNRRVLKTSFRHSLHRRYS